jgi:hypothetical protein
MMDRSPTRNGRFDVTFEIANELASSCCAHRHGGSSSRPRRWRAVSARRAQTFDVVVERRPRPKQARLRCARPRRRQRPRQLIARARAIKSADLMKRLVQRNETSLSTRCPAHLTTAARRSKRHEGGSSTCELHQRRAGTVTGPAGHRPPRPAQSPPSPRLRSRCRSPST